MGQSLMPPVGLQSKTVPRFISLTQWTQNSTLRCRLPLYSSALQKINYVCITLSRYSLAGLFTSAEGGCVFSSVCLSVCLSVRRITEKVVNGFWRNFLEGYRAWPRYQWVQCWWLSGSPSGSRSPKSEIRIQWIIEKVTNGLWRAWVWSRDQLITFWWRSASLSGSWRPFRITIRIREELAFAGLCWVCSLSTSSCSYGFYRATLCRARYCHDKLFVRRSIRLSVCLWGWGIVVI